MTSITDILSSVFTSDVCTFCGAEGLTYTDPETRCLYCLPCLVIAVESEGQPEEPEAPAITQMGRDYIRRSRHCRLTERLFDRKDFDNHRAGFTPRPDRHDPERIPTMLTATMPQKTETMQNAPECPAFGHDGAEGYADTPEGLEAVSESIAEAFTPDTAEKVNWVLGKIADSRARAARIRENAEAMAKAEDREADALEWRYGPALQAFARRELGNGKKKSVRLYNGVLGYRTRPAGVNVTDPAAALLWAKENLPDAVTESVDKRALSAVLLDTGEVLDFAQLTPAEEVFYIR